MFVLKKGRTDQFLIIAVNIVLLLMIGVSVCISFRMNCVGRSLWLDEAMLWDTLANRSLLTLTDGILDHVQSAPIIYIYVLKIFSVVFGTSEFILRMPAFISYIGLLIVSYLLFNALKIRFPLIGTLMISSLSILMKYASEVKQYMTEAFLVMTLLYLYGRYVSNGCQEKEWKRLIIIATIFLWGGNPVCFAIGGILLTEFAVALIERKICSLKKIMLSGMAVALSFFVYYLYWLKPVIDAGGMTAFWKDYNFSFVLIKKEEIIRVSNLIFCYLSCFDKYKLLVIVLFATGLFAGIIKLNRLIIAVGFMLMLSLVASSMGLFPICDRIWLFFYPIIISVIVFLFDNFAGTKTIGMCLGLCICGLVIYAGNGIITYWNPDNVMRNTEEIKGLIEYAQANITNEELYLYSDANLVWQYYTGKDNKSVGKGKNNVIYGKARFDSDDSIDDVEYIVNHPDIFLMFYHPWNKRVFPLFKVLTEKGYLYLVKCDYDTPLYFYSKELLRDNSVELEFVECYTDDNGEENVVIRIKNTGEYYVGNNYNELCLCSEDGKIYQIVDDIIAPGDSLDVSVNTRRVTDESFAVNLRLIDQFNYKDLGVDDLICTISK